MSATSKEDPLASVLRYERAHLDSELEAMGLKGKALETARAAAQKDQERVKDLVAAGDAPVVQALCPSSGSAPPRYTALPYVLEEVGDRRVVVNFAKVSGLRKAEWAGRETDVLQIFESLELPVENRVPEATLLGVAAVVMKKGDEASKRLSYWRLRGSDGWETLVEENPGVEQEVARAIGAAWLLVETAKNTPGFCAR